MRRYKIIFHKTLQLPALKFIAAAFLLLTVLAAVPAPGVQALPSKIWESVEESVITRGVTLEKIKRFTVEGWLNINVLRVDMTDSNISFDALYNSASIQELTTVKTMAERQGAVAAINGGYFEWNDGWGGSAIGTEMKGGRIDTAFSGTNAYDEVMGSITINNLNEAFFAYCKPTIVLKAGNAPELYPGSYNKKTFYDYYDISILDRKWVQYSVGATQAMPDIVELVAEDGIIKEVRVGMPAIEIPINGFVAVARVNEDGSHLFSGAAYAVGSPIEFTVAIRPNLEGAVMHIEGASMLLRDGAIPQQFTFETAALSQRNPHTMIGCNKDGDELLMVTVDGRQAVSIGITTYEAAEMMLGFGAYNALRLDGGGSTTMVARPQGMTGIAQINISSDSSPRAVVNGIGVFTHAPRAAIRGLIIDVADPNVFVGTHRQFTVRAYDRFYNPVEVAAEDIAWSISGFRGQIDNGLLVPETSGEGTVRAKVGKAVATVDVKVLSTPSELVLNTTSLSLSPGQTHTFTVIGRDRMGFSARINASDITWSANDSFGTIDGGVFMRGGSPAGSANGALPGGGFVGGYIAAAYGNAVAYCAVQPIPLATSDGEAPPSPPPPVKLPPASRIADSANREIAYTPSGAQDTFRFGVLGESGASASDSAGANGANGADGMNGAERLVSNAFTDNVNKSPDIDCGIFVGASPHAGVVSVTKPAYATNSFFEVHKDFCGDPLRTLIRLSSIGNGIRAAGKDQWSYFFTALKEFSGKDLFIALQQGPSTFSDRQEAALFKQTLAEYARSGDFRIWVFYAGATDSMWLEDGVRYFTCAGAASATVDKATGAGAKYLEVTVQGSEVTYVYKPLT